MRVLVVEDEQQLRLQVCNALRNRKYAVDDSGEGREALFLGQEHPYDLVILDLGLPGLDGLSILRQWRSEGIHFPVIILTARGHWQEKVEGLEAGADDYLVKPFHVEELLARVQALIRRASGQPGATLTSGEIRLDTVARKLTVDGQSIELTAFEFNLLEFLMRRPEQIVSKTQLTEHLYDQDYDRDSNTIEVFVRRVRQKLEAAGILQAIVTIRGQGYRFDLPVESVS